MNKYVFSVLVNIELGRERVDHFWLGEFENCVGVLVGVDAQRPEIGRVLQVLRQIRQVLVYLRSYHIHLNAGLIIFSKFWIFFLAALKS